MNELKALKDGPVLIKSESKMSIEGDGSNTGTTKIESILPVTES